MSDFTETLRAINDRLVLPQPAKSRVLLEIAADLRDMYEYYRALGLSQQDARHRAIEHCDLSDEVLTELTRLHTSAWRRFMDRFSEQAQTRWERALMILTLVFMAAVAGRFAMMADVFAAAHAWVWACGVVTALAVLYACYKLYLAFVKQAHDSRRLRAGLSSLLVAAGTNLLIGAYGNCVAMYDTAQRAADDLERVWLYAAEWLLQGASLQMACLSAAVVIALFWYVITNKVSRIERAEAAALLG
jgi:hypothetical protein